jgi:hypothetical protein
VIITAARLAISRRHGIAAASSAVYDHDISIHDPTA